MPLAVKGDEAFDPVDIGLFGAVRIISRPHPFSDLIEHLDIGLDATRELYIMNYSI